MKRTHASSIEQGDAAPKNQIPNQQFFAKMHQQDVQQSRSLKRQPLPVTVTPPRPSGTPPVVSPAKAVVSPKQEPLGPVTPRPKAPILQKISPSSRLLVFR